MEPSVPTQILAKGWRQQAIWNKANQEVDMSERNIAAATLAVLLTASTVSADPVETGEALYAEYCAKCHGANGSGDGEFMEFKSTELPDLRTLSLRNDGFPLQEVVRVIDGRAELDAHGERFMPAWGEVFGRDETRADAIVRARILNLILYLDSIQQR